MTMIRSELSGMGVALVTPFLADGNIDFDSLKALVENQIESGTDFLVVLGTTAETPTLSDKERQDVMDCVRTSAAGRIPLVVGYGGNNTAHLVKELKSHDLTGFCAILSVVPFYNKPTQEGIYQHFKAVAEASPLPVIVYNVPSRTGAGMTHTTTLRLANDIQNICAVKEASGNIAQIAEIIEHAPEGFKVFSGDDGITFPLMQLGADGVISVIGNAYPKTFSDMVHHCQKGEWEKAKEIHFSLKPLTSMLFADGNPGGIKCALWTQGKCQNRLRLPLVPVRKDVEAGIAKEIQLLNKEGDR